MSPRTEPVPPLAVRIAHLLALSGALAVILAAAAALTSGTATPGLVGWSVTAVACLIFFSASARAGRRWGRAVLPVAAAASLGSAIPEAVPLQGTAGPPLLLLLAGSVLALTACVLPFLATDWFREHGPENRILPRRTRKVLIGVHVIVSLVWCGVICTTTVLAVTAALSSDPEVVAALTPAMVATDTPCSDRPPCWLCSAVSPWPAAAGGDCSCTAGWRSSSGVWWLRWSRLPGSTSPR